MSVGTVYFGFYKNRVQNPNVLRVYYCVYDYCRITNRTP